MQGGDGELWWSPLLEAWQVCQQRLGGVLSDNV